VLNQEDNLPDLLSQIPEESGFQAYLRIMDAKAWNRSLGLLYATRSYEAGLAGARKLLDLTGRFKPLLANRQYERHLIRLALLELTCLDRLDWLNEYLGAWTGWRSRPLTLTYKISRRRDPRIGLFVMRETDTHLDVHFLYLTRARKEVVEGKIGNAFRRHARQEELTEEDLQERFSKATGS
jgi:hypothetical protein